MSNAKIPSRNLSYTSSEPAFLQRLRAQQFSGGADPDRHERQVARPQRLAKRGANDEDDDAPTYVLDENSGEAVSKEEWEGMVARTRAGEGREGAGEAAKRNGEADGAQSTGDGLEEKKKEEDGVEAEAEVTRSKKQEVTEVGQAQKKRKVARVVAGDEEEDVDQKNGEGESKDVTAKPMAKKVKKKVKPVKLSFGD